MSVHAKEGRWVVRWRQEDRQRSRAFPTRREAAEFDRAVAAAALRGRERDLTSDLLALRVPGNAPAADDDPDRLRMLAADARRLADEADRRADELDRS